MKRKWRIASEEEIVSGKTTDVYFDRAYMILKKEGIDPFVYAEVTVSGMPQGQEWGVIAGIEDVLKLFEGKHVDVYGLTEGTVFAPRSTKGVKTPVLAIEGPYTEFAVLETPMLGFLCHTSGMVTKTANVRIAAGEKSLLSFGARRTHPAITPQVGYAAYIGGCDGISCVLGAEMLDLKPTGTMPHAIIIAFQDHVKAWQAYDRHVPNDVPRIALTDTYLDEVKESIMAAEHIKNLTGVRLDTPSSRKGNFARIVQEVRWELDVRGYNDVKIFVSGGLDAESIRKLSEAGADGFGVGGAISNAPAIDFAMDIVAINQGGNWIPAAKRGKFSGKKIVWCCEKCLEQEVTLDSVDKVFCPSCNKTMQKMTVKLLHQGKILQAPTSPKETREYILDQIWRLTS